MTPLQRNMRYTTLWALGIGLVMALFLFFTGVPIPVIGLVTGLMLVFTFAVSLVLYGYRGYMQRRSFEGKKSATDDISAEQQKTVDIDLPYDAAFTLALDALRTLDGQPLPLPDQPLTKPLLHKTQDLTLHDVNPDAGLIEAGLKVRTMGIPDGLVDFSRITIRLERIDAGSTRLTLRSVPNLVSEAYDMGKNLHYVNSLALYLRHESQIEQAEDRLSLHDDDDSPFSADDLQRASQR